MNKNIPENWQHLIPIKTKDSYKYVHGHALIYGAPKMTGATNLAASACARMGAGLVSVLANKKISDIYRTILPAHIIIQNDLKWFDKRVTARLYGSGGLPVKPDFNSDIPTVLDADALKKLPLILKPNYVLTPHQGEFEKTFPYIKGIEVERSLEAARQINAYVVLKGAKTVIAAPDGRYAINESDAPYLATAGTGDVLAGMITGLIAQKMPIFEACCAAVWIHSKCAHHFGMGLVSTDLVDIIPIILQKLVEKS